MTVGPLNSSEMLKTLLDTTYLNLLADIFESLKTESWMFKLMF